LTVWTAERPNPSPVRQWWVLTVRVIAPTLRNGELLIAITLSGVFTVCYYLPLKNTMGVAVQGISSSYAQYLMPLITLMAIYFAGMSGALRSATDSVEGINRRFASMPMAPMTPLAARMSCNAYRCVTALATAILYGYLIGFRFHGGTAGTLGFCLLVLLIGVVVAFVGDLIGVISRNPEATTHILLLPAVILILLSVGLQPVEQFPGWIQPFVRDQPFSQFASALRELAGDTADAARSPARSAIGPALAWLLGVMVIAVPLYRFVLSRRR
jgi:ABC-2 type transport system permease protein